jgi:hypothetical protein
MLTQVPRGESAPRPVVPSQPGKFNKQYQHTQAGPRNRSMGHRTGPTAFVSIRKIKENISYTNQICLGTVKESTFGPTA